MINDELLLFLPHLLEKQPELFSNQDLHELDDTINLLETESDDNAENALYDFYVNHRHIRDALRDLSEAEREINNLPPSSSKQYGVTNFFPRLHQIIKDIKEKRNPDDEPQIPNKTS
jgi:hypothetical protein